MTKITEHEDFLPLFVIVTFLVVTGTASIADSYFKSKTCECQLTSQDK